MNSMSMSALRGNIKNLLHLFKFLNSFFSLLPSSCFLFYLHTDLPYVKMVQHVPILMEVTPVFVSMDGLATIAVKILTIVLMRRALMERHVLMA